MSEIRPLSFSIYKGITGKWGAAQFLLQEPHLTCASCKEKVFFGPEADDSHYQKRVKCEKCGKDLKVREGAVFLDVAPTTAPNVYDWKDQKIIFALSVKDIGQLLYKVRVASTGRDRAPTAEEINSQTLSLVHDPNMKGENQGKTVKRLTLSFPKGTHAGGMLKVTSKNEEAEKNVTIPLTGDELLTLVMLLEAALPVMLSWR